MSAEDRTTGTELEASLGDAEVTLAATTRQRGRLTVTSSVLYISAAVVVVAAVAVAVRMPYAAGVVIATVAAAGALCGLAAGLALVAARRREVVREEQHMVVTVNRIREVLLLVAAREEWTGAHERAVRARLARFSDSSSTRPEQMIQRALYLFSVATLLAAVVILASYLASRNTSWSSMFDEHWDLLLLATGLVLLGLLVAGAGVRLFYSVADGFMPHVVAISLGVLAAGALLVYLGVSVVLSLG